MNELYELEKEEVDIMLKNKSQTQEDVIKHLEKSIKEQQQYEDKIDQELIELEKQTQGVIQTLAEKKIQKQINQIDQSKIGDSKQIILKLLSEQQQTLND